MPVQQPHLFSVVIPALNEGDLLRMTVESILSATEYPDYEVLVVNDGSTDGSVDILDHRDPRVRVLRGGGLGVARARNLGARHSRGEYIAFIDAHCRVSSNWLCELAQTLVAADVGLVGPCFTKLEQPEPRGCGMSWTDYTLDPAWFEPKDGHGPYEVPLSTGACQVFRRTTFYDLGCYDEGFLRWGFEDVEICLRAWLLGYRVVVNPRATVAHYFRQSRNYEVDDLEITYNFLRMIHMHFSAPRIRRILRAVRANPLLPEALTRLYQGDIFQLRAELHAARVHDDDWFFQQVNQPLAS